jgi:hypothetical protein
MASPLPKTMRAWQYASVAGGLQKNLELRRDVPVPKLSTKKNASELLVETISVSLNPADYKIPEMPLGLLIRTIIPPPAVPCMVFFSFSFLISPFFSIILSIFLFLFVFSFFFPSLFVFSPISNIYHHISTKHHHHRHH